MGRRTAKDSSQNGQTKSLPGVEETAKDATASTATSTTSSSSAQAENPSPKSKQEKRRHAHKSKQTKPFLRRSQRSDNTFISEHKVSLSVALVTIVAYLCVNTSSLLSLKNTVSTQSKTSLVISNYTDSDGLRVIGGWRQATPETLERYDPGICNVERIPIKDLPPSRFESEFRYKKPVIVTFANGADSWTIPYYWTKEALVSEYKDWTMRSGQSLDIVRKGGNAKHKSSFLDFVDKLLSYREGDEPLHYGFDRSFYFKSNLPNTLHLPPYFKVNSTEDESIFFLGASLTGVVFHRHSDTWNGVVFGRKRWFIYPISKTPPGGVIHGYTLLEWVNNIYPTLEGEDKPIECVQEAGEIIYVPENMYHATLNLGDTIALAIQKKVMVTPIGEITDKVTQVNKELTKNPQRKELFHSQLLDLFTQLHNIEPGNAEAYFRMGLYNYEVAKYELAVEFIEKALEIDPNFVMAQVLLGRAYGKLKEYERAEQVFKKALELTPILYDVYDFYGELLVLLKRCEDALPILKRGTELKPDSAVMWKDYRECQLQTGDHEGAMETLKMLNKLEHDRRD